MEGGIIVPILGYTNFRLGLLVTATGVLSSGIPPDPGSCGQILMRRGLSPRLLSHASCGPFRACDFDGGWVYLHPPFDA